jgi:hypothetical protein
VVLGVNAKTLSCRFPAGGVDEPKVPYAAVAGHVKQADMTPEQRALVQAVLSR